jgi:hypothetical protein
MDEMRRRYVRLSSSNCFVFLEAAAFLDTQKRPHSKTYLLPSRVLAKWLIFIHTLQEFPSFELDVETPDILPASLHTTFFMRYLVLPFSVWCLRRIDFQRHEDKVAGKLPRGVENYTMAGCTSLVKLVLTPQKRSTT